MKSGGAGRGWDLITLKVTLMTPITFEVSCNISPENPLWKDINSVALEIGYPGRGGEMLWKSIGWLRDHFLPAGKNIAHALWDQTSTGLVLIFDFLPKMLPDSAGFEKTYRIRKKKKNCKRAVAHLKFGHTSRPLQ
jgi:hypothetical protein